MAGRLAAQRLEDRLRGHAGTPGNERCDEIARAFSGGIHRIVADAPAPAAPPAPRGGRPGGQVYVSLVDGIVARHATWAECDRRVRGVRGARFKKARNDAEVREIVAAWGLGPDALFGI
jgi:ribonuclease HI